MNIPSTPTSPTRAVSRPIRLLLVDDHRMLREGLRRSMELYGFDVVGEGSDGEEGIRLAAALRPDVVLMDVHMPGMDGYSAIRAIRDWETQTASARTPIVVLSSDDLETQRRHAAQSGCSGFLRKPIRIRPRQCFDQR